MASVVRNACICLRTLLLLLPLCLGAGEFTLSPDERAWVAKHPVVRIQMSDSSPPFEFRDQGRWQGLAYDHLVAACDRLGLRVEVTGMPWEQALAAISEGKGVDLLLAVTRSPERERQMLLTRPYLAFPQVIVADHRRRFISGLADLRSATVAVENSYVIEAWLRRDLPDARFFTANDSLAVLQAVSDGRADAYVGNLAVASYLVEKHGLVNLGVVAPSGYGDEDFAMGVRRDWPELVALLDRALATMPQENHQEIRQRWLAVRYDFGLSVGDIVLWVVIVSAVALLFIVQLRRMVKARTRELAREVELRREGEARVRLLIDRAPEAIVLLDPETGLFVEANPGTERVYGVPRERIVGAAPTAFSPVIQPDGETSADKSRRTVAAALAGGDPVFPWLHIHPDGTEVPCEVRLTALPWDGRTIIRCSVLDMREHHRHEEQLRRAETLSSLGHLAGSVAHDFNNVLSGIVGFADLIGATTLEERTRNYATSISRAVQQATSLTSRLLAFARRGAEKPEPFDAHAAINAALDLFGAMRSGRIELVRSLQAEPSRLLGFPGQLQNAVLNLCINARDAMSGGGRLEVRSSVTELDQVAIAGLAPYPMTAGPHLHVEVADHGCGMEPAVLARCLDPLFTTKGDKGTGLGLPGVHSCVLAHHGALRIDSVPGTGTTVHLWLPLPIAESLH